MDQYEIELALINITNECEILNLDNPITYLIFLQRYESHLSTEQIVNVKNIIEKLRSEIQTMSDVHLRKFSNPISRLPLSEKLDIN